MKNILLVALLLGNVVEALAVEHYVNVNNPAPSAPYLTWATAAASIQAAIDAASDGDVITVTNGVYQTGGSELFPSYGTNRVSISKALLVQSVNGPAVTVINGAGTMRCVAFISNAVLSGFTLTNGFVPDPPAERAAYSGGGGALATSSATLTNCVLTGNSTSASGGGAYGCTLNNCILTNNGCGQSAVTESTGGGASWCNLNNCLITGNRSPSSSGGGADSCALDNCTVSNNFAAISGGGIARSIVNNCIIVNNVARIAGGGADSYALTNCWIAGNSVTNTIGGSGGGATHGFGGQATFVNCVFVNNRVTATNGQGGGFAGDSSWLYNCAFTNNSASVGGAAYGGDLYDCILAGNQATNGTGLGGGAAGDEAARLVRCLLLGNSAKRGGGVAGVGYSGVDTESCVFGGNSASVAGGGVYGGGYHHLAVITNNIALDGGGFGYDSGYSGTSFDTCQFSGNVATNRGGAVYGDSALQYCTLAANSAGNGGGGVCGTTNYYSSLYGSIIYHNSAPLNPNCDTNSAIYNSCTTPIAPIGYNNFTNDPVFVNLAAGNYRLSSNSPCINYVYSADPPDPQSLDLDRNPRRVAGGIDLGAFEFQNPLSAISYQWLQQHGLPTDGSTDYSDPDGDSFNNYTEWRIGTDPLDAASFLKVRSISVVTNDPTPLIHLEWQSMPGLAYVVEGATTPTGPFTHIDYAFPDSTNAVWEYPIDQLYDLTFFRVGAQ